MSCALGLPEPADGDLFFDIEGARYYSEDGREFGLQYLFGVVDTAEAGEAGLPRYTQIWAFDRAGEKRAFEELIDFITERRARHPGLHVYHYNHYEPTSADHLTELHGTRQEAVGALMGRFATREDEVDDLFRLGVFTDLYRVVRQGVRAAVESYSIKRLEPLCGYGRRVDLAEATVSLIALEAALEDGTAAGDGERQRVVAGYNQDDCRATLALRDWLEEQRAELAERLGQELPRPVFTEKPGVAEDPETARIRSALLAGVSAETSGAIARGVSAETSEGQARALLADLLDWHRREDKPAWWRYFYLRTLSPAELTGEPDALGGLTGGDVVGQVKKSVVRRFRFPPQEHKFSTGVTACDPDTDKQWTVCDVDDARGTIDLKMGSAYSGPWPAALVEAGPPRTWEQRDRLRDLGDRVVREGARGADAATALLLRRPPDDGSDPADSLRAEGETASAAAVRLAVSLRRSYLPMQGPPGTGKTYTAAEQILELIAHGRTVGITGPSNAVICHLIDTVYEHARWRNAGIPRIGQRADRDNPHRHEDATTMSNEQLEKALRDGELDVAAGTSWLWARAGLAASVDTLFVDEAGQLSLANVLAVAGAAQNLVLLGDPQQLAQPSHATHPPGAGASALEHILGGRATMPAAAGLLLDQTWRMHPDLCRYTSAAFYEGKLHGVDGLGRQEILGWASGLRLVEVPHQGNTNASPEEAREVARLAAQLTGRTWHDKNGTERSMEPTDILIVTPQRPVPSLGDGRLRRPVSQGYPAISRRGSCAGWWRRRRDRRSGRIRRRGTLAMPQGTVRPAQAPACRRSAPGVCPYASGGRLRLLSRNGNDMTASYPGLGVLAERVNVPVSLDGEIIAIRGGRPDFGLLQSRMHVRRPCGRLLSDAPVQLYLSGLLKAGGEPLLGLPTPRGVRRLGQHAERGSASAGRCLTGASNGTQNVTAGGTARTRA